MITRTFPQQETTPGAIRKVGNDPRLPTAFVDTLHDALASDCYRVFVAGPAPTLSELLDELEREPAGSSWTFYGDGHYPTLRTRSRIVLWSAQWFGGAIGAAESERRWYTLDQLLRREFGGGLYTTPATTGRALWARTIPDGETIATMSESAQSRLRAMSGQGRMEMFAAEWRDGGCTVREYDQRWAYTALTRGLPTGEPVELDAGDARDALRDRFATGRFHVSWTAPEPWPYQFGLLPELGPDGARFPLAGAGWVDAVEVELALQCGWSVDAHGALVWERRSDPLRTWIDKLERLSNRDGVSHGEWVRQAVRSIILHTIGAFHGSPSTRTEYGPEPPADALRVRPAPVPRHSAVSRTARPRQRFAWSVETPRAWPEMHHPEWSSTIWARARRRLLDAPAGSGRRTGALHLRPGSVVAFRTDAIYTTDEPEWHDDGRAGRYRLKSAFHCPHPPANAGELLNARRSSRGS